MRGVLKAVAAVGLMVLVSAGCTSVKAKPDGSLSVVDLHPFRSVQNAPGYTVSTDSNGVKTVSLTGYAGDTSKELGHLIESVASGVAAGVAAHP